MRIILLALLGCISLASYTQTAADYFDMGNTKYLAKEYAAAINEFTKAIELEPLLSYAYTNRGLCKKELKDFNPAILDFTKAIELDPKDKYAFFERGDCYFKLVQKDKACKDWGEASELDTDASIPGPKTQALQMIKKNCQ